MMIDMKKAQKDHEDYLTTGKIPKQEGQPAAEIPRNMVEQQKQNESLKQGIGRYKQMASQNQQQQQMMIMNQMNQMMMQNMMRQMIRKMR